MTRARGELPEAEEALLGIERQTPEQEAEAAKTAAEEAHLEDVFLRDLIANPLFRKWLWTKLQSFNTFGHTFAATPTGFPDPNATWFHAGIKAAGWSLWEEFDNLSPLHASMMRREGLTRNQ